MSTMAQRIDAYLAGAATLRQAVAGMSRAQLEARPVPGKWSSLQVVCHLTDFEPVYADRMKRVIAEERPAILGADEQKFAAALAYDSRDVAEELAIVDVTRQQMARILRTLPESAWQRVGVHNEAGPLTLADFLQRVTNHIPHHVQFIYEKRRALGLPV